MSTRWASTSTHDQRVSDQLRFVQLTPPGSACSIAFGDGLTPPGTQPFGGLQVVVESADTARAELMSRGLEVEPVDEQPWGRFVYFKDPDGNSWALQELVRRS